MGSRFADLDIWIVNCCIGFLLGWAIFLILIGVSALE